MFGCDFNTGVRFEASSALLRIVKCDDAFKVADISPLATRPGDGGTEAAGAAGAAAGSAGDAGVAGVWALAEAAAKNRVTAETAVKVLMIKEDTPAKKGWETLARLPRRTKIRNQFPAGFVFLPACDIGAPYFARLAAVSGTGPFVTVVCSTVALVLDADVSALGAIGVDGVIAGCEASGVEAAGAVAGAMAGEASCAQVAPAREAATKPAAAAILKVFTARVPSDGRRKPPQDYALGLRGLPGSQTREGFADAL
jgi:hypothetical protein